jgi:hypothetical protein
VLSESGPDALPRPQRVPFTLPPAASGFQQRSGEAWSHGLDLDLLHQIATVGGGIYNPDPEQAIIRGGPPLSPAIELRPLLLVAMALLYLLQIGLRRLAA